MYLNCPIWNATPAFASFEKFAFEKFLILLARIAVQIFIQHTLLRGYIPF